MSSSSALMIAVLLALVRANHLDRTTAWTGNLRNETGGPGGVRGDDRKRSNVSRAWPVRAASALKVAARITRRSSAASRRGWRSTPSARRAASGRFRWRPGWSSPSASAASHARKTGEARDDYNRASRNAAQVFERWLEVTGRRDESLAAAVSSSNDAARPAARDLLRRRPGAARPVRPVRRGEHAARARRGRSARARRPRRIWSHGGAVAGACRKAAAQPGAGDGSARQDGPRRTARGRRRPSAPDLAAACGRSSNSRPRTRLPRSVAECVSLPRALLVAARSRFFLTRPGPAVVRLSQEL